MRRWSYFLAGVSLPGFGYACAGYYTLALATYVFAFAAVIGLSYLATLTPLAFVAAIIVGPCFLIFSGVSSYRLARSPRTVVKKWLVACILVPIFLFGPMRHFERVIMFAVPTDSMSPSIISGDHFALDQRPSGYKVGDIVAIELEHPNRLTLRRIKNITGESVSVATDTNEYPPSEIPSHMLRGKALYIVYSRVPGTLTLRKDRFLLPIAN